MSQTITSIVKKSTIIIKLKKKKIWNVNQDKRKKKKL